MFFAAYARLLTSFSITRLELLLNCQGTNSDFQKWATKLKDSIPPSTYIYQEMEGIINREINEKDFLLHAVRLNAISSCILNYTSSSEYFLVDLIQWKLNDKRILKRALDLKDIVIKKFDIVDFENIEDLRAKYIQQLSGQFSEGELWTKKISNACKLFDIPFDKNQKVIKSIDSIWEQRNKFAHLNKLDHLPISFTKLNLDVVEITELIDDTKFLNFCLELIALMTEGLNEIYKFQQKVGEKWQPV